MNKRCTHENHGPGKSRGIYFLQCEWEALREAVKRESNQSGFHVYFSVLVRKAVEQYIRRAHPGVWPK